MLALMGRFMLLYVLDMLGFLCGSNCGQSKKILIHQINLFLSKDSGAFCNFLTK